MRPVDLLGATPALDLLGPPVCARLSGALVSRLMIFVQSTVILAEGSPGILVKARFGFTRRDRPIDG